MFVLQSICDVARATPEKLAFAFNGRAVSYGVFWRMICGLRAALAPHAGDRGVALLLADNILEAWILVLALRSLGLDTVVLRGPEQVGLFAVEDVACLIALADEPHDLSRLPPGLRAFRIGAPSGQALADEHPPMPAIEQAGGHIVMTSGTTGVPKKVRGTGGENAERIAERQARYDGFGGRFRQQGPDTVLNLFSLGPATGAGASRPIFTWAQGGAIVIQQSDDFWRALTWPGLTHTVATPWFLARAMAQPDDAFPAHPDMQLIVTAGAMTPALAHDIQRRLTRRIMINLSSTEVGGWARTVVESDEDLTWYRVEPGREVEVVDDADQPLPTGQLGRVRVALRENTDRRGYWGDPQASAAFFKGRWFYSGDLGVLDGAGRLALYGRSTDVVAVEGDKLPAAAWEQALQARLGCDDICILSGRWGADGEEALHVFLESRRPIPAALLEQAVRETLFGFSGVRLHKLDALPRTPMGKVRRVALAQAIHEGRYPGA